MTPNLRVRGHQFPAGGDAYTPRDLTSFLYISNVYEMGISKRWTILVYSRLVPRLISFSLLSSPFSLLLPSLSLFSLSLSNIEVITRVSNTCNQNINTNRYKVLYACISIFLAHHFPSNRAFCLFWNWDNPVVTRRSDRAKKLQVYRGEMISFERETGQVEKSAILSGDNFRRRKHGENPSSAD